MRHVCMTRRLQLSLYEETTLNLKLADFSISEYSKSIDEADVLRLQFFRKLWGVMEDAATEFGSKVSFSVPSKDVLAECSQSGKPVFSVAPANIPSDVMAETFSRLTLAMTDDNTFDEGTIDALKRVKWDRIVAASNTKMAVQDPSSYVESLIGLLQDDGMDERSAQVAASAASLGLRALLNPAAVSIQKARLDQEVDQPYPMHCPVCGCAPAVARVGGGGKTDGRSRTLWCPQCGCTWDFERVRCARCGTKNQKYLHFFNVEGDDSHRIATCDKCGGYIRTTFEDQDPMAQLRPFVPEVEDVIMTRLDLIAYQQANRQAEES